MMKMQGRIRQAGRKNCLEYKHIIIITHIRIADICVCKEPVDHDETMMLMTVNHVTRRIILLFSLRLLMIIIMMDVQYIYAYASSLDSLPFTCC